MCQFKSGIILKDRIYLGKGTSDSHTDLLEELGIKDKSNSPEFVRVELIPPGRNEWWKPIEEWKFNRDQDFKPDWYFDELEEPKMREEVKKWLEKNKIMFDKDKNIGIYNTGNRNTGDRNTGNRNTGDCNTGNRNTGSWNTGDRNTGNRNTGSWNTGSWNTGNRNTGDCNTGDCNTGNRNTGDRNTGSWNTGDRNTGNRNTGSWNTGSWNTGNRNTGDWNKCNHSTGFFNTIERTVTIFNADSGMTYQEFINSNYYDALTNANLTLTKWIWYTEEEMENSPIRQCTQGYLKQYSFEEAFEKWWSDLSEKDHKLIMSTPNFDKEIFKEITGIDV